MKTWGALKAEVGRIVNDPQLTKFSDIMLAGVNDALRMLASVHTGVASVSVMVSDGGSASFPLPSNSVEDDKGARVRGVYDVSAARWLMESNTVPGGVMEDGWFVWPDKSLRIQPKPRTDAEFHLYYVAYYAEIVNDDDVLEVPPWAYEAIKLYTAGTVLEAPTAQLTLLANFRTKVDSGNPEHNPMLQLAKYYKERFWEILNLHPTPQLDKIVVSW